MYILYLYNIVSIIYYHKYDYVMLFDMIMTITTDYIVILNRFKTSYFIALLGFVQNAISIQHNVMIIRKRILL